MFTLEGVMVCDEAPDPTITTAFEEKLFPEMVNDPLLPCTTELGLNPITLGGRETLPVG